MLLHFHMLTAPTNTDQSTTTSLELYLDLNVEYQEHGLWKESTITPEYGDHSPDSIDTPATSQKVKKLPT